MILRSSRKHRASSPLLPVKLLFLVGSIVDILRQGIEVRNIGLWIRYIMLGKVVGDSLIDLIGFD